MKINSQEFEVLITALYRAGHRCRDSHGLLVYPQNQGVPLLTSLCLSALSVMHNGAPVEIELDKLAAATNGKGEQSNGS